ncbi:hypothetical protein SeLEV6574_g04983, partial [Synchytrium endobioticum]
MAKANRAKSTAASSQAADMSPVDDMEVDNVEGNDGGNINIVGGIPSSRDVPGSPTASTGPDTPSSRQTAQPSHLNNPLKNLFTTVQEGSSTEGMSSYFSVFEIENRMVLDVHQPKTMHNWSAPVLEDEGSNWNSWFIDMSDMMIANRLFVYSQAPLCALIQQWKSDYTQSKLDQRLYYLHRERMLLLKNITKSAISPKLRLLVQELSTPAEIFERLKSNFEIRSDSTKQKLTGQWNALALNKCTTFQEYLAKERNLVDSMTRDGLNLGELVTDDIRAEKIKRTMPKTLAGRAILQYVISGATKLTLKEIVDIISRNVDLLGNEEVFGQKGPTSSTSTKVEVSNSAFAVVPKGPKLKGNHQRQEAHKPYAKPQKMCTHCKANGRAHKSHNTQECRFHGIKKAKVCKYCATEGHYMDQCEKLAQLIQESHTSKKRKVPIRSTIHMMEKLSLDNKDEESNELDPSYLKMYVNHSSGLMNENTHTHMILVGPSDDSRSVSNGASNSTCSNDASIHCTHTNTKDRDERLIALVDTGSDHSFFNDVTLFKHIERCDIRVNTIIGHDDKLVTGSGPVTITLHDTIVVHIPTAYYVPTATTNILSYNDVARQYDVQLRKD